MTNLPQIHRPIYVSYTQRDFRVMYRIAEWLGLGERSTGSGTDDVWYQFPSEVMVNFKIDHTTVVQRHSSWENDVGKLIDSNSASMLIVLTKYSAGCPDVQREFDWYPSERTIWLMPIAGAPVPEVWRSRSNIRVCEPPDVDLAGMCESVCAEAHEEDDAGRAEEARRLYFEAINLLGLADPGDLLKAAQLFMSKGRQEIKLGLGRDAVRTLEAGLSFVDFQEQENASATDPAGMGRRDNTGDVALVVTAAVRAQVLSNLGVAHMVAQDGAPITEEERADGILKACACWQEALDTLTRHEAPLRDLEWFQFDAARSNCLSCLDRVQGHPGG